MNALKRSTQGGASLMESVIGLAIVAVGLGLAVPGVQGLVQGTEVNAATEDVLTDIRQARAEALKRNRRVTICKSADGSTCSGEGGWEQGWIMFHDENGNGLREAGEETISRHGPLAAHLRVHGNTPLSRYISYSAVGSTRLVGGGFQAGTLTVCSTSSGQTLAREVVLNAVGRPRSQKVTVLSCA